MSLVLATIAIYVTNNIFLKPRSHSAIIHGYLNDFLAIVMLLGIANILMVFFAPVPVWRTPRVFVAIATLAALYWEFVTPLYAKSISDPLDFISYGLGAVFFLRFTCHLRQKCR